MHAKPPRWSARKRFKSDMEKKKKEKKTHRQFEKMMKHTSLRIPFKMFQKFLFFIENNGRSSWKQNLLFKGSALHECKAIGLPFFVHVVFWPMGSYLLTDCTCWDLCTWGLLKNHLQSQPHPVRSLSSLHVRSFRNVLTAVNAASRGNFELMITSFASWVFHS